MGTKLHELLAAEQTVSQAAEKILAETNVKFNKPGEYFHGAVRELERVNDTPEDKAIEQAQYAEKALPTTVPDTLEYLFGLTADALNVKLGKHLTNQAARADVTLDDQVLMADVPVDFLLDLEKLIPKWRAMFDQMPTRDASREWDRERDGVWRSRRAVVQAQTNKIMYPVELAPATKEHPAQVKESTKDVVVGTFRQTDFSGAATSEQKADVLKLCDRLLVAVKEARMRANSTEVVRPGDQVKRLVDTLMGCFK